MKEFRYKRITLREFNENDFDLLYSIFSNEKIMRYAFWDKFESREDLLPYFDEILENNKDLDDRKAYEYAVFLDSTNEFIGFADAVKKTSADNDNDGGCAEIGYFLLEAYWGMGYATEIASAMLDICFNDKKLHKVIASCHVDNASSENIMKKIGMQKEGRARNARYKDGKWVDELRYSILYDEWKK